MRNGRGWDYGALALAGVALFFYGLYRARFVACCDPAAYYLESLVLRGEDLRTWFDPTIAVKGPLGPLCTELLPNGRIVSFFPPGFPLLLLITAAVGAPFYANPVLGAASGLALFHLAKTRVPPAVALGMMAAWLCSPGVFFYSTQVMSDLSAAAFAVFALLALDRQAPFIAGLMAGFSIGIRPTQVLFGLVVVLLERRPRVLGRVLLGAVTTLVGLALLLSYRHGGFYLPYVSNVHELTAAHFAHQVRYLGSQTVVQHLPIVALVAVATWKHPKRALPYLVWFFTFLLFYGLWSSPIEEWWYIRFLLPALPGLFLVAADGAAIVVTGESRVRRIAGSAVCGLSMVGYCLWATFFSPVSGLHYETYGEEVVVESQRVAAAVPGTALVGAVNYTTPLRMYGHLQSFLWLHPDAAALVEWAVRRQRPVYAVLDDEERSWGVGIRFDLRPIEKLPSGKTFYQLLAPLKTIDIGTRSAHRYLLDGWSGDERAEQQTFAWAVGERSLFRMPADLPEGDTRVRIALSPFGKEGLAQQLFVAADGEALGSREVTNGDQVVDFVVPGRHVHGILEFKFAYAVSPAPDDQPGDHRRLAAAFDWISFEPVP